jgi:hypothetical protein
MKNERNNRSWLSGQYDGVQLRIESKRLKSGRCQVKFYTRGITREDYYGYLLVDSGKTLSEVMTQLKGTLENLEDLGHFYQRNLFAINRANRAVEDMVIYRS